MLTFGPGTVGGRGGGRSSDEGACGGDGGRLASDPA